MSGESDELEAIGNAPPTSERADAVQLSLRWFAVLAVLVATVSLAAIAVATSRLAAQGERADCVDRPRAVAGLERCSRSDGSTVVSEATRASAPRVLQRCPDTEQLFESTAAEGESGDGLPMSGTASRAAAERTASSQPDAAKARVVAVDGRAWTRDDAGDVEINRELLYVVDVEVGKQEDCPRLPVVDGVPIRFFYWEA